MKDPKHPHQPTRPVRQSGPLMRALEPRIMFDAAVAATVTDNVHADSQAEASPPAEPPASDRHELLAAAAAVAEAQNPRQEIVFVDTSVADYQSLVNGINTGAEVVLVHAGQGGLQVIADTLQGRSDIDAIHILSHGDTGKIWLGNDWIDSSTITTHQALLSTIGSALSENGDILLYGCRVAEDGPGFNFIRLLADATGADIAASNDLTGSTASGGDWILESQVGQIDANTLTFAAYHSLLAVPLDENYDDNPGVIFNNQNSFELDGVRYTINGSGIYTTLTHNMNDPSLGLSLGDNASDYFLLFDNNGIGGITSVRIEVSDGSYFKLSGLSFNAIADSNITITPYDGVTAGTGVSYARTGDFITREYINLPEDFQNISSFTIAGENLVLTLDDLDFEPPVIPNTAPIINNLNGDSVNWSGVNNWVTLDAANNATVTDAELDVANWDDATLTIQRAVSGVNTPLAADLFRFNESGFTVNGNNLQSGATTFGTFTNVNGVLSIEFNANADATLVQSVMRGIQYRNDTPTGDTVIRFALSDGDGGSATADVTVTSDTIYVTSATDTTVIDVSDGVSFREAVAIAAADLTGSQTIVFSSALAGLTLDINGPTNINESLIFDMDATGSITLSGGPIALGMGTTQTFINGAGDTATITNSILGAGAITKMGAGNLTLSGLNSFSGATTISEGTLTVSGADAISANSNVSVAAGATLALTSNATIGNLSGAGDIDLGSRVLTTTQTADTVFSGNISETGGLTITQHINAGYSLTLSGTNSYSGNTTTTNYGWVRLNGDASVSANSALRIHDSSKVTLLSDQTVGSLAMNTTSATLDLGVGGYTLTAGGNNTSTNVLGVISGSGNLWKQGTGTMTVTGINNTYNGNTVVTGGTLSIASDAGLGSGTVILGSPDATLAITGNTAIDNAIAITDTATISVSADATISGIISGDNLRKAGTAKLTLSGNNTYTGTTSVGAGILSIGASTALGDGNILLAAGTTLDVTGVTDITNDIVLSGNATISNSANVTVSGDISGNFNLTKSGNLTLTLSGDNTYLNTTVSAGTLSVASDTDLGNGTVSLANGSTLSITGNTTIDNAITLTGNATINAAADATLSGAINGGFNLTKSGASTLTLTGTNTYTGSTTINGGTLSVAGDSNLGAGTINLGAGNSTLAATGSGTIDNNLSLTGSATLQVASDLTWSGIISGNNPLNKTGAGTLTLSATNTATGATTVSAGSLLVTGSIVSATNVSSGATLGGTGTVGNIVTVQNGGTLAPGASGVNGGIGRLTINGGLDMQSGSTLAIQINGTDAGDDYDQLMVSGAVNVSDAILAPSHNYVSHNGDEYTIIDNDGVEGIYGIFAGVAQAGTVTAGGNGSALTANYSGGDGNDFTLIAPINSTPVVNNLGGSIAYTAGATVLLDSGADVEVTDVEDDVANWNGGSLVVQRTFGGVADPTANDIFGFASGMAIEVDDNSLKSSALTFATFTNTGGVLTINFTGTDTDVTADFIEQLIQNITYRNDTPYGDATIRFSLTDSGGRTTHSDVILTSSSIYVDSTHDDGDGDAADGFSLREALDRSLAQASADTIYVVLPDNSTITFGVGAVSGAGDTLDFSSARGLTVTGSTLTLDGALTINTGSSDVTLGSNLVGTATLTKVGTGTLTLTNTDNEALFSGDMALNGGTLAVGADNSLSSGNLQFDGGTLRVSTGGTVIDNAMSFGNGGGTLHADVDWTASGVFSGSGQLNKTGFFGILTLSGTSGHTGVTSIAEGMLAVGGDENLGTGILELNGGAFSVNTTGKTIDNNINVTSHTGIIQIDLGLEATLSGLISGTSEILKNGGGKLNLTNSGNSATSWSLRQINGTTAIASADMIGSGNLRLMGGTLEVNATSDSIFSQAVHVTGATTINADGSNSSVILTFSGAMTGSGALSLNAGDSTLTFTNSANRSSFAGNIDVVTGTLAVANSDALSDGVISLAHDTHMRIGGANGVVSNDIIVKGYVYLTTEAAVSSDGITFTGDITENSLGNMITLNANATNRIIFSNNTTNVFITSLQSGTLVLAGAEFDQNLVTDSGTRLEGSGDIFNLLVSGTLAPGADGSAGRINANNDLTFLAGAKIEVDLGGPVAAIDYDQIAAYGTMSLSGAQVIINSNAYIPQPGDRFMFIDHASGNMYIPFANLQQGDTYTHNGRVMYFTYQGGDGDDIGFVANTAPSVDTTAALALNPVQEDAPAPTNGSTTHATLVHDLIGTSMTDPDTTARGIAITGISDQGTLYYSTNSGSTWTAVTSELSDTSALLLAADVFTWLYFQPHANEDGTIPDAIRFRAWDLSTGTVNTYADVSTNGGSTAFSAATAQISIHVDPINDAPTITAPGSIPIMEDIPGAITGISFTDVDAGSSPVTVNLSVPAGTLAATSGSGVTVSGNGSVMTLEGSVADINAFIAAGQVTYTTALNEFTNVALTVGISDNGNTGSGGALSDTVTVMLDVSAINDAPENSIPAPQQVEHNGTLVFNAANGNAISIRDVDAGSSEVEVTLTATNGLISLGSTSGLNFVVGSGLGETTMTFSGSISDINIALANLVFTPARNYHGAATIEITTNDMGWSGNGGAQRDTDIIGITVERPDSPVHVDTPTAPQAPIRPSAPAPVPTIGTSAPMIVLAPANSDSALSGVLISVEAPALISSAIPPIPSVVATGLPSLAQLTAPGYASSVHVQPGVESVAASLPSFTADTRGAAGTGTAITAAASAFIDRSTMNAEIQLQAQRDIGSFNLQPGAPVYIALPENTFSADASSQLTIEARQGNGAPLPSWLRFDPVTGTFTGKVPTGFHGALTIEIIIRDSKDNLASSRLQLIIGAPTSLLTPMDLDELFTTQNSPAAKADLASQFAQFGRAAWDAEANALLTRLQAARS